MHEDVAQALDQTERRALLSILTNYLEDKKRGSFKATLLSRLVSFLRSDSSHSTDDDIFYINEERIRLLEILQDDPTIASHYIPVTELRSLIIFLNTSILDGPAKATQEINFCLENLELATNRPNLPFTPSATRLLQRVLRQIQSEASDNLLSTLEASVSLGSSQKIPFFYECIKFLKSNSIMPKTPTPDASSSPTYSPSSSFGPAQKTYIDDKAEMFEPASTDADPHPPGSALPNLPKGEILLEITENHPDRKPLNPFWVSEYPDLPIFPPT